MTAERALTFDCRGEPLVGILGDPAAPAEVGVVIVVGGPQYRAGSHRQFVLLSRALVAAGFAVLRFDVRGMGDSAGAARDFESIEADIGAAIDTLQALHPTVRRVVLWGLCDGASAALLYVDATRDARVAGLCLLNPWVRSVESLARAHVRHYYRQRLSERAFWMKLLSGRVGARAWQGLMANLRARRQAAPVALTFQGRMARGWNAFQGNILLLLSGNDLTAREFADALRSDATWAEASAHARLERHDLPDADHTFSDEPARQAVDRLTRDWLARSCAPRVNVPAPEAREAPRAKEMAS